MAGEILPWSQAGGQELSKNSINFQSLYFLQSI